MKKNQTAVKRKFSILNLQPAASPRFFQTANGFTLVELLVVISIIAILAGFAFPILKSVKKTQYIKHTTAELGLLETAIQRYHDAYGFYPPSNPNYNPNNSATSNDAMLSPLYYELLGTTINGTVYSTLDGSAQITTNIVAGTFGLGGFVNCTKGSGDDVSPAKSFLSGLKPGQTAGNGSAVVLVGSVGGPDANYQPLSGFTSATGNNANPFRYVSPGVNNPGSYDLWIQLSISGKTYLVCNWNGQVQVNNPLP
jgi:prepilin-type N-terminal cleavage/methylation domain-containing protein